MQCHFSRRCFQIKALIYWLSLGHEYTTWLTKIRLYSGYLMPDRRRCQYHDHHYPFALLIVSPARFHWLTRELSRRSITHFQRDNAGDIVYEHASGQQAYEHASARHCHDACTCGRLPMFARRQLFSTRACARVAIIAAAFIAIVFEGASFIARPL